MTEQPLAPPVAFNLREHVIPQDRGRLFDLLNTGGYFYPYEMAYGMALFDEHLLRGEKSSYQFMLYEAEDKILAYGCFGLLPLTDRRYHLHWLVAAANHLGQGIGKKLEAAIVARVRMQGGVRIYAEISNRPHHARARKFYELCGYRLGSVITGYYAAGDDKMFYVKDI